MVNSSIHTNARSRLVLYVRYTGWISVQYPTAWVADGNHCKPLSRDIFGERRYSFKGYTTENDKRISAKGL